MQIQQYLDWLVHALVPQYTPPTVTAGHDWPHCDRMARHWGPRILGIQGLTEQGKLQFDMDEYRVTCWLHNLDRVPAIKQAGVELRLREYLTESPFGTGVRERIIQAIKEHPKFMDEPGDDHLLTALRIADKLDRLDDSTMGVMVACAFRGTQVLFYDPAHPFHYTSTEEGKLKSIYNDFMRQLEWYGMLPSDEARGLVSLDSLRFYTHFVRRFAAAIVRHVGGESCVEDDLRRALGKYYDTVAGGAA